MTVLIDDAFITAFEAGAFGLPIAYENEPFEPVGETAYAEIFVAANPKLPLSLADTDQTSGIFRIILRYPVDDGALDAKEKADAILAAFPINSSVTAGGQSSRITMAHRGRGIPEKGWYKMVVTISYEAFISR